MNAPACTRRAGSRALLALLVGAALPGHRFPPADDQFHELEATFPFDETPDQQEAIDAVLADLVANGVTAEELERSKSRMIANAIYANDNQRMLAQWYGASLATGATVEQVRAWPDRIALVSADAVRDAARRWLDKRRSVTGYLVKDTRHGEKRS